MVISAWAAREHLPDHMIAEIPQFMSVSMRLGMSDHISCSSHEHAQQLLRFWRLVAESWSRDIANLSLNGVVVKIKANMGIPLRESEHQDIDVVGIEGKPTDQASER